jgi:hypothetical protein
VWGSVIVAQNVGSANNQNVQNAFWRNVERNTQRFQIRMLFHWGLEIIERFDRVLNETFYDNTKQYATVQLWGVLCQASAAVYIYIYIYIYIYGCTHVQPYETNYSCMLWSDEMCVEQSQYNIQKCRAHAGLIIKDHAAKHVYICMHVIYRWYNCSGQWRTATISLMR